MTGELTHTISKERMAPDLMICLNTHPTRSVTDWKVKW